MGIPYIGEIRMFAGNFAPVGWMLCQGQFRQNVLMAKSIQLQFADVLKNECDHNVFLKREVAAAVELMCSLPRVHLKAGRTRTIEMKRQDFSIVEDGPVAEPSEELSGAGDVWKFCLSSHCKILA